MPSHSTRSLFRTTLLAALAVCGAAAGPASASEQGDVVLVLNGAKSMSGALAGRPKLEIAREAFAWYLGALPDKQRVGLVAFGHRKANDCKDVEALVAPGALSPAAFSTAISQVAARGNAPLADAIRTAATLLPAGKPGTLIVAADSADSCRGDPCATAAGLKSANPGIVIHVLGLGPKPTDLPTLACIAQTTGGKFIPMATGGDIVAALRQTTPRDAAPVAPPPKEAGSSERASNGDVWIEVPKEVVAGSHMTIPFDGPVENGDWLLIADTVAGGSSNLSWQPASNRSPAKLTAPARPGKYEVRYVESLNKVLVAKTFEVKPATVTMQAPQSGLTGHPVNVTFSAPTGDANYIAIVPLQSANDTKPNDHMSKVIRSPAIVRAPLKAGDYEVRLVFGAGSHTVVARQKIAIAEAPPIKMPEVTAEKNKTIEFDIENAPRAPGDFIYIASKGSADNQNVRSVNVLASGPIRIYTPGNPGDYEIRYLSRTNNQYVVIARSPMIIQ
jgi:Ca-activated chloride channel family protein